MKHLRYVPLDDLVEEAIARVGLMIEDKQDGHVVSATTTGTRRHSPWRSISACRCAQLVCMCAVLVKPACWRVTGEGLSS